MSRKITFILLICQLIFTEVKAAHLIGAELTYECLGNSLYEVNLDVYRDCYCEYCADFDPTARLAIFNSNNNFVDSLNMFLTPTLIENLQPNTDDICVSTIPDVCVERYEYSTTVTLPDILGGYNIVWQRCCRNNTINNIQDPGATGNTYIAHIPGVEVDTPCNSSPSFNNFPPIIICANYPLIFDHSATDIDGDSLVYSLCDPFTGASQNNPYPAANEITAPPHANIDWLPGFGTFNQLGGNPALSIDSETGLLTGTPLSLGQYVVGICVQEFRDGVLLSTNLRDFQFNVADCIVVTAGVESDDITITGELIINECGAYQIDFDNNSTGATNYWWDFGDPNNPNDQSTDENPSYTYPTGGEYDVVLVAEPGGLCTDTAFITIFLYPFLVPGMIIDPNCSSVPSIFTDASVTDYSYVDSWLWDFGDGNTSSDPNTNHLYADGGTYDVSLTITNEVGCEETLTESVTINPSPITAIGNTLLCIDQQPIDFSDESIISSGNIVSWEWDFGDTNTSTLQNPSHTYAAIGDYTVELLVTSDEGCESTFTFDFTIYPVTVANAGPDQTVCGGDEVQLMANGGVDYQWDTNDLFTNTGSQEPLFIVPVSLGIETYDLSVEVFDPNGCSDIDQVTLTVLPQPNTDAGPDVTICLDESTIINASASDLYNDANNVDIVWSPNTNITGINTVNPEVSPTETTVYVMTVTDLGTSCVNIDSVVVNVLQPILPDLINDVTICEGDEIQLVANGGDYYEWTPATGLSDPNIADPFASPLSTTTYSVNISNDCFESDVSVTVEVNPLPYVDAGESATINIGETVTLQGDSEYDYNWSPQAGILTSSMDQNPVVQPLNTTQYVLTAESPIGCIAQDSTLVEVTKNIFLLVPTAFSPNGDGQNDVIFVNHAGIRQLNRFSIWNRWGELVFTTTDINQGWDGYFKGQEQPISAFGYAVDAISWEEIRIIEKGNITLIR